MKKVELKCYDLDLQSGEGLAKYNGKVIKIANFLPKEEGLVEIDESRKYNKYKLLKLYKVSNIRVDEKCSVYEKCGSCHLLHMDYKSQFDLKKKHVINQFKLNKLDSKIDEEIKAENKEHYRNKMQVSFKLKDREIVYGFYEEESHRIIPMKECLTQSDRQNEIVKVIAKIMKDMKIMPYDEDKRTGVIRFVMIREGSISKEILVTIVTHSEIFPGRNDFIKRLRIKCPYITSIVQNINNRKTSIILGENEKVLFGTGYIVDKLCGIDFKISSKTFYQINHEQTEKLYGKVLEYADLNGNETVIDAYCGVGTIGMVLSTKAKEVYGVESNKQSVINARSNAYENKIKNIKFVCEDATEYLHELAKEKVNIDVLIMDPPRSGSTEKFLNAVSKLKPKKVIYVSCDPITLVRDLSYLLKINREYVISKKCIVDMFVGTNHIETVVLLHLKTYQPKYKE